MKLFWKKNKMLLIILLLLLITIVVALIKYRIDFDQATKDYYKVIAYLEKHPEAFPRIPQKPVMYDTYNLFSYLVVDSPMGAIMFVMPFIIMLCGIYNFYFKIKTGFFKDECMRRSFNKNMILNVLDCWKAIIIIPLFIIVLLIGCYITTGSLDVNRTIDFYDYSLVSYRYLDILPAYFTIYTINLMFVALFSINIALIVTKKNSNLFVTLVQSYLIFIVVGVFTEVVIGRGLEKIYPTLIRYNFCNSLAIFNFWVYDNVMSLGFMVAFAFLLFASSTMIVIFQYRNKESVNLEIDK